MYLQQTLGIVPGAENLKFTPGVQAKGSHSCALFSIAMNLTDAHPATLAGTCQGHPFFIIFDARSTGQHLTGCTTQFLLYPLVRHSSIL